MSDCADCVRPLDDAAGLYAGCGRFACRGARDYRRAVLHYLERQATADLAATAWAPLFVLALIVGSGTASGVAAALLAVLCVPPAAALAKLRRARATEVPLATVLALGRERERRTASLLQKHRGRVASFERRVTTPLLLGTGAWAAARALAAGSWAGAALAVAGLVAGFGLYLGADRRGVPCPIRDFAKWTRELEPVVPAGGAVRRADGELVSRAPAGS